VHSNDRARFGQVIHTRHSSSGANFENRLNAVADYDDSEQDTNLNKGQQHQSHGVIHLDCNRWRLN